MTESLLNLAKEVAEKSYSPYSKFRVGAAIRTRSGKVFKGTNVENVSYSNTLCAETSAIAQMIAAGEKEIQDIYIYSPTAKPGDFCTPCGSCRQKINEFCDKDTKIYCYTADGDERLYKIDDLLPDSFGPDHL